jgi:hypothetical protein
MPAVIAHDESGTDVLDRPGRLEAATRAHSLHVVLMLRRRAIAPELGEPLHLIRRQYFVFR